MILLRDWQQQALGAVLAHPKGGVVQAVMGAGKSYVIGEVARRWAGDCGVIITAPTQVLVEQLASTCRLFVDDERVGVWYEAEKRFADITVVCHASLPTLPTALPPTAWIADECHQTECDTVIAWRDATNICRSVGFTATPWRASARQSISSFDELIYRFSAADALDAGHVVRPELAHPDCADPDQAALDWVRKHPERRTVANASSISDCEEFADMLECGGIPALRVHSKSGLSVADAKQAIQANSHVVCYVDMLAEGFNEPTIEAMVLRRNVESRLRFVQEIGRGLRACEKIGKTCCHQLDIHDLYGHHALDWRAALGEVPDASVPALQLDLIVRRNPPARWSDRPPATVLGPLRGWLRSERVKVEFDSGTVGSSTSWRSDPPSQKQIALIRRLMEATTPDEWGEDAPRIWAAWRAISLASQLDPDDLQDMPRKGDASDLITILKGRR